MKFSFKNLFSKKDDTEQKIKDLRNGFEAWYKFHKKTNTGKADKVVLRAWSNYVDDLIDIKQISSKELDLLNKGGVPMEQDLSIFR